MAFGESIVAYFGGDISGLKKACSAAAAEVDNLNQRMGSRVESGLARSFLGLSAIRAVRGWASEAIKAAQDTRDEFEKLGKPIDENTDRLARFGDALDGIKKTTITVTGAIVSFVNMAGEGWGTLINDIRGVSDEQVKAGEKAQENADKQVVAAEKLRIKYEQELPRALEKLKAARESLSNAGLDDEQKEAKILSDIAENQKVIDGTVAGTLKNTQALTKQAELQKSLLEVEAKLGEKEAVSVNEYASAKAKLLKREEEALPDEERRAKLEAEIADLTREHVKQGENDINGVRIANELLDAQEALRQLNLKDAKEQAKAEQDVVTGLRSQMGLLAGIRGGNQFNEASTDTLKDVARKDRARAAELLNPALTQGNIGTQIEAARLNLEAQNAERIIGQRGKLMGAYQSGGIEAARRSYQGDPLLFDQVMQRIKDEYGTSEKQLTEQRRTNDILTKFIED